MMGKLNRNKKNLTKYPLFGTTVPDIRNTTYRQKNKKGLVKDV